MSSQVQSKMYQKKITTLPTEVSQLVLMDERFSIHSTAPEKDSGNVFLLHSPVDVVDF
jgi:hypothetical protein